MINETFYKTFGTQVDGLERKYRIYLFVNPKMTRITFVFNRRLPQLKKYTTIDHFLVKIVKNVQSGPLQQGF